jgi:DNA-binding transcriptional MerR regulator
MKPSSFNIGRLSRQTGVQIETIRYYEKIALLSAPARTRSGYRQYEERHVERLRFIRRGRDLGFSIESIRALLALAERPDLPCDGADNMVASHLAEVDRKIEDLNRLRVELLRMTNCPGRVVAECKIMSSLATASSQAKPEPALR